MRYHYKAPKKYHTHYGKVYICDHPVYNKCTLYTIGKRGLAVIQQRYSQRTKTTWWGEIDPWLVDEVYLHPKFKDFFEERSAEAKEGLYPTVSIRQLMWGLKMKPLKRERWETCFDRRLI